ncbi:6PF2K domain-containing protein [Schizosaccharomyces pombe]|uniref:Probable fructose-2,6-bisphosphatase C732.02c n=1 Tax=Schizosaccharomyces pombe (strain 972 / ATCC 24843) TaxID=284812 RepID=YK72_SCHPO|nr:putative fructose-2,6-bisphosphate 2-phosphatase [Schizosaccharomyces pombe]Q9URZ7.1 RecName: Full=Probable fructose-2,6-bisphosphatase C732.02c [Schizosaccharomyces pombe 972h-]CAB62425.1 fructose-2,6-bisphosphate 2-phosphatase activity (predicted) [Schizosaccharomyces pombe]|eukprot:NP_593601.1 putative fructose-2,6-bisphosphate 2-phosphatase [Schizosaccharomyces pombe]
MKDIEGLLGLCVCFVGLPASGKTSSAMKLSRYLTWMSVSTHLYDTKEIDNSLSENSNSDSENLAKTLSPIFDNLESVFKKGTDVAILDFNQCTLKFRKSIVELAKARNMLLMFVEVVCTNQKIIDENITDMCQHSPYFKSFPFEESKNKILDSIHEYEKHYTPLSEAEECTFVRIVDFGAELIVHKLENYLESRIVYYLSNLRTRRRSIWLSRHGESQFNVEGKIGGDSSLSPQGLKYAALLPEYVAKFSIGEKGLTVWTSSMARTIQTARHLNCQKLEWRALDELDAGTCDGFTYDYIEQNFPHEAELRNNDKFHYRYRGGESYMDVVRRLEPIIMELERQGDVFIICHQAILRCIYGYYHNLSLEELPFINVPLHTIIKLTPMTYETIEERVTVPISAVSTQRGKH